MRFYKLTLCCVIVGAPLCASLALGEGNEPVPAFALFDPSNTSPVNITNNSKAQLILSGSTDDNVSAQARVGLAVWSSRSAVPRSLFVDATFKGPIQESTGQADLASLDGLQNAVTGSVGLTFSSWLREPRPNLEELDRACQDFYCREKESAHKVICAAFSSDLNARSSSARVRELTVKEQLGIILDDSEQDELAAAKQAEAALDKLNLSCDAYLSYADLRSTHPRFAGMRSPRQDPGGACRDAWAMSEGELDEAHSCDDTTLTGDAKDRFRRALDDPPVLLASSRSTVGRQSFEFVDEHGFEEGTTNTTPYSLEASVGVFQPTFGLLALNYKYQESYKGGPERQICQPFSDLDGIIACSDATVGAPKKVGSNILQVEWRRYVWGPHVALNPTASVDLAADVVGLDLPIYFLMNDDGLLNGGVRVGWRSDTRDVTAVAFVGTAFSFPGLD